MITLDPELLRCFIAIADTGSLTAAGDRLGLTQPGVSIRLKKLEDRLQKPLLIRQRSGIVLTAEGAILLKYARQMINLNQEIIHYFNAPDMSGTLRLGIADYVAHTSLQFLLRHFRKCYPKVSLEIHIGLGIDLIPKFDARQLDVVISGIGDSDTAPRLLYQEQLVWACAPEWQPHDKGPVDLLSLPAPCSHRAAGIAGLEAAGIPWQQTYTSTNIASIKAALAANLGIAILPISVMDADLRQLRVADGFPPLPLNQIGAYLLDPGNPLCQVFLDFYMAQQRAPS